MAMYVTDPRTIERVKEERDRTGASARDEVWEGIYVVTPMPNNEHQQLVSKLTWLLTTVLESTPGVMVLPGANVSDRDQGWTENYREPDVVVVLPGSKAIDRSTHWQGGPDFLVEILSPDDPAREKIPFYSKIGVRELLIVDRDPWRLELWKADQGELHLAADLEPQNPKVIVSDVLPVRFSMEISQPRPRLVVESIADGQRWIF